MKTKGKISREAVEKIYLLRGVLGRFPSAETIKEIISLALESYAAGLEERVRELIEVAEYGHTLQKDTDCGVLTVCRFCFGRAPLGKAIPHREDCRYKRVITEAKTALLDKRGESNRE